MQSVRSVATAPWPWPLPALAAWIAGWAVQLALAPQAGPAAAFVLATAAAGGVALVSAHGRWRRLLAVVGFPLSALTLTALPAWAWLVAVLPLALAYPLRAWRDAPFFPTPADALQGLGAAIDLPDGARVLDAGCGVGHGLAALRRVWPRADVHGIEWSRLLAWLSARRCRDAGVERGDMWAASWAGCAVVYVFQRPESMAHAWAKATHEMAPGSWLVSLEFEVPGVAAHACAGAPGGRPVWVYRVGRARSTAPARRR